MFDFSEFVQGIHKAIEWLILGLAYPLMDGNALAFSRFLTVFVMALALRASAYRHWTVRAGLGIFMFFLGMDALLGLAPKQVQVLTVALLGRNVAMCCLCFGLAFFPSTRTAAKKRNRIESQSQARQVAMRNRVNGKENL